MELEKTLFRVHERLLSSSFVKYLIGFLVLVLSLAALFFLSIFIYANLYFRSQSTCLSNEFTAFQSQILNNTDVLVDELLIIRVVNPIPEYRDQLYSRSFFNMSAFQALNLTDTNDTVYMSNYTNSSRVDPRNFSLFYQHPALLSVEYVMMPQLLSMPRDVRVKHQFNVHTVLVDAECYGGNAVSMEAVKWVIGFETIVINEILSIFKKNDVLVKNLMTEEIWFWRRDYIGSYGWNYNVLLEGLVRFLGLLEIVVGLFLVSNITAIYIKMTIVCAPIFILILTECCIKFGIHENISRLHVFKAFPWVGMYLYALAYNNRKAETYIYFAFFCMIFLFYFVYLASSSIWSFLLFRKSIPLGLDENFYGFIACIEFLSILFIRTRSAFKYIPLFLNFLFVLYLYYVKFTLYGYFYLGLYFTMCLSFAYFGLNLLLFEIPALSWNPSYHYVPSLDKPRLLYFPLFSISSYYDLPHFWSMFYPLHDRSFFSSAQMALVDRNYVLLNSTLENARMNSQINNNNNNNNNPNLSEISFDVEMQNLLNPQNANPAGEQHVVAPLPHNEHPLVQLSEEHNSINQNLLRQASLDAAAALTGNLVNNNQRAEGGGTGTGTAENNKYNRME